MNDASNLLPIMFDDNEGDCGGGGDGYDLFFFRFVPFRNRCSGSPPTPVFLPPTHSFFYFKFLFPRVLLHGISDLSLLSSSYDHSMMIVIINEV